MERNINFRGIVAAGQPLVGSELANLNLIGNGWVIAFFGSSVTLNSARAISDATVSNAAGNTFIITNGNSAWRDAQFENSGTVNWTGNQTVTLDGRSMFVNNDGIFNFSGNGTLQKAGANPDLGYALLNHSSVTKTGAGVARIFGRTRNEGTLDVQAGRLTLITNEARQRDGITIIAANATLRVRTPNDGQGTFYLNGGKMTGGGVGQFNLVTNLPDGDPGNQSIVIQATQGQTLRFEGNLTLNLRTVVYFASTPAGPFGILDVVSSGGDVPIGGTVFVNGTRFVAVRDVAFQPPLNARFAVIRALSIQSQFITFDNRMSGYVAGGESRNFNLVREGVAVPPGGMQERQWLLETFRVVQNAAANANPGNPVLFAAFENDPDFAAPLSVASVDNAAMNVGVPITTAYGGSFMALADGSMDYVPATGFYGDDSVVYTVSDGTTTKSGVVTIHIPNPSPHAIDTSYSITHDTSFSLETSDISNGLLDYAFNFDTNSLAITEVDGFPAFVGMPITTGLGNTLTVNADGTFSFSPAFHFVSDDSFTVTFSDGVASATITVTLHVTNSAPTAPAITYATLQDQSLNVLPLAGILLNPVDDDGDTLTLEAVNGNTSAVGTTFTTTNGGSLTVQANGSFTYVPASGWTGDDTFTYTLSDGIASSTATVIIHVVATMPSASDAAFSIHFNTQLTISAASGLLSFGTDPENDSLILTAINGDSFAGGAIYITDNGGLVLVLADGSFVYDPPFGFIGTDSFTFTVSDGIGSATATAAITVTNTVPNMGTPTFNVNHDLPLNVAAPDGLVAYCSDNEFDLMTVTEINGSTAAIGNWVTTNLNGSIKVEADGSFEYQPPTGIAGVDSFTFTVFDGAGSANSSFTINVNNVAPSVGTPSYSTTVNTVLTSDPPLLFWCVDNDGDQLHITQINGQALVNGSITLNLANGATITVNDDGTFVYTPADDLEYDEELTFTVFDGIAEVTASWFIHITAN